MRGIFPKTLKLATIIPVFKKGDSLQCNDYIYTSLTSNLSKIIEKLVYEHLNLFLKTNNISFIISLALEQTPNNSCTGWNHRNKESTW